MRWSGCEDGRPARGQLLDTQGYRPRRERGRRLCAGALVRILHTLPPNFAAINRAFNVRGKPVIYCYGGTIHNPSRIDVTPELIAHEAVHSEYQGNDPKGWWEVYIDDPRFRLAQEIPAHAAEYRAFCDRGRTDMLDKIAERLASPMYGSIIALDEARRILDRVA